MIWTHLKFLLSTQNPLGCEALNYLFFFFEYLNIHYIIYVLGQKQENDIEKENYVHEARDYRRKENGISTL